MTADQMSSRYRVADYFSHIDMGFLNRRLAISALGLVRDNFITKQRPGSDHMTPPSNYHLLLNQEGEYSDSRQKNGAGLRPMFGSDILRFEPDQTYCRNDRRSNVESISCC